MSRAVDLKDLKRVLAEFGLSQAWAAKQLGITPTYLGMIASNKASPSAELRAEIVNLQNKIQRAGLRAV